MFEYVGQYDALLNINHEDLQIEKIEHFARNNKIYHVLALAKTEEEKNIAVKLGMQVHKNPPRLIKVKANQYKGTLYYRYIPDKKNQDQQPYRIKSWQAEMYKRHR